MRLRYISQFVSHTGVTHMISLYNRTQSAGGTPINVKSVSPGYSLEYNRNLTEVASIGGIIQSSAKFTFVNESNNLALLLQELRTKEKDYLVQIHQNNQLEWTGILLQDFSAIPDNPQNLVEFTAVDGISLLSGEDVTNINPATRNSLLEYIITGLSKLPTAEFHEATFPFVRVKTNWTTHIMPVNSEPLSVASTADTVALFLWEKKRIVEGYDGSTRTLIEPFDYRTLIEHVLTRFKAVLIQAKGIWYIYQFDAVKTQENITFHQYDKLLNKLSSFTENMRLIVDNTQGIFRSQGSFSYTPGLKSVEVTYLSNFQNSAGLGSLLPNNFTVGSTYTTYILTQGTGNKLHISFLFQELFNCNNVIGDFRAYVQYNLTVTCGAYYLYKAGIQMAWSLTPNVITINSSHLSLLQGVLTDTAITTYNRITNDLPASAPVTITLERGSIISVPFLNSTQVTPIPPGTITHISTILQYQSTFLYYIFDNQSIVNHANFKALNSEQDYTLEYVLDDSMFGSVGQASRGLFHIWNGSQWVPSNSNINKLWNSYPYNTDKYFNELLAAEVLRGQMKPLLIYNGTIVVRQNIYRPYQAIVLNYRSENYICLPNRVTYTAQTEDWTGDWIELSEGLQALVSKDETVTTENFLKPDPVTPSTMVNEISESLQRLNLVSVTEQGVVEVPNTFRSGGSLEVVRTPRVPIPPKNTIGITNTNGLDLQVRNETQNISLNQQASEVFGYLYNTYFKDSNFKQTGWRLPTYEDFDNVYQRADSEVVNLMAVESTYWSGVFDRLNMFSFNIRAGGSYSLANGFTGLLTNCFFHLEGANFLKISETGIELQDFADGTGAYIRLVRDADANELLLDNGTNVAPYIGNDGTYYSCVKIDSLVWMTSNLMETKYVNNITIPKLENEEQWEVSSSSGYGAYEAIEDNAISARLLDKLHIDSDVLEGKGTVNNPTALKNKKDGRTYAIEDGKFTDISTYTADWRIPAGVVDSGAITGEPTTLLIEDNTKSWVEGSFRNMVLEITTVLGRVYAVIFDNTSNRLTLDDDLLIAPLNADSYRILHTYELTNIPTTLAIDTSTNESDGAILLPASTTDIERKNIHIYIERGNGNRCIVVTRGTDRIRGSKWGYLQGISEGVTLSPHQWDTNHFDVISEYNIERIVSGHIYKSLVVDDSTSDWQPIVEVNSTTWDYLLRFESYDDDLTGWEWLRYDSLIPKIYTVNVNLVIEKSGAAGELYVTLQKYTRLTDTYEVMENLQIGSSFGGGTGLLRAMFFQTAVSLQFGDRMRIMVRRNAGSYSILEGSSILIK